MGAAPSEKAAKASESGTSAGRGKTGPESVRTSGAAAGGGEEELVEQGSVIKDSGRGGHARTQSQRKAFVGGNIYIGTDTASAAAAGTGGEGAPHPPALTNTIGPILKPQKPAKRRGETVKKERQLNRSY